MSTIEHITHHFRILITLQAFFDTRSVRWKDMHLEAHRLILYLIHILYVRIPQDTQTNEPETGPIYVIEPISPTNTQYRGYILHIFMQHRKYNFESGIEQSLTDLQKISPISSVVGDKKRKRETQCIMKSAFPGGIRDFKQSLHLYAKQFPMQVVNHIQILQKDRFECGFVRSLLFDTPLPTDSSSLKIENGTVTLSRECVIVPDLLSMLMNDDLPGAKAILSDFHRVSASISGPRRQDILEWIETFNSGANDTLEDLFEHSYPRFGSALENYLKISWEVLTAVLLTKSVPNEVRDAISPPLNSWREWMADRCFGGFESMSTCNTLKLTYSVREEDLNAMLSVLDCLLGQVNYSKLGSLRMLLLQRSLDIAPDFMALDEILHDLSIPNTLLYDLKNTTTSHGLYLLREDGSVLKSQKTQISTLPLNTIKIATSFSRKDENTQKLCVFPFASKFDHSLAQIHDDYITIGRTKGTRKFQEFYREYCGLTQLSCILIRTRALPCPLLFGAQSVVLHLCKQLPQLPGHFVVRQAHVEHIVSAALYKTLAASWEKFLCRPGTKFRLDPEILMKVAKSQVIRLETIVWCFCQYFPILLDHPIQCALDILRNQWIQYDKRLAAFYIDTFGVDLRFDGSFIDLIGLWWKMSQDPNAVAKGITVNFRTESLISAFDDMPQNVLVDFNYISIRGNSLPAIVAQLGNWLSKFSAFCETDLDQIFKEVPPTILCDTVVQYVPAQIMEDYMFALSDGSGRDILQGIDTPSRQFYEISQKLRPVIEKFSVLQDGDKFHRSLSKVYHKSRGLPLWEIDRKPGKYVELHILTECIRNKPGDLMKRALKSLGNYVHLQQKFRLPPKLEEITVYGTSQPFIPSAPLRIHGHTTVSENAPFEFKRFCEALRGDRVSFNGKTFDGYFRDLWLEKLGCTDDSIEI